MFIKKKRCCLYIIKNDVAKSREILLSIAEYVYKAKICANLVQKRDERNENAFVES